MLFGHFDQSKSVAFLLLFSIFHTPKALYTTVLRFHDLTYLTLSHATKWWIFDAAFGQNIVERGESAGNQDFLFFP